MGTKGLKGPSEFNGASLETEVTQRQRVTEGG